MLASGYAQDGAMSAPKAAGWDGSLEKPFTSQRLLDAVSAALQRE